MSNLTLDGSTSFIGTEFIKLLATGSSNLATEEYVDYAIEQNGGGGGNVDLSNYYTQTETDNLLNNKLNVNNPQDITGNLRLDPTNGLSKIILNAVSPPNASDDFYCNGNSHINGTMRVSVLTSDGDVNSQGVNADTFNSNVITNDIVFKHNDVEYMRFNATNDTIDLSKELNLGSSTLKINSISTNGLNDMTFGVDTLGEFLRLNISDFTVRVPDNRSFLAQNIFTDIIKPLTFSTDVVFNGGNSTNDAYEEYMRLDASTETVNISKNANYDEAIVMKLDKVFYLDNATIDRHRYIYAFEQGATSVLGIGNQRDDGTNGQIRFINGTSGETTSLIIDKSFLYTPRQIQGNNGLKVDFIDTRTANADFQFRRNGSTAITLKASNEVQFSGYLILNNISTPDNTDLALRRDDDEFMRLFKDGTTLEEAIICSKQLRANAQIRVNNLQINQFSSGVQFADFRLEDVDSIMRFYVGNSTSANLQMTNAGISLRRETTISSVKTNFIDTDGDSDLVFRRNGTEIFKLEASVGVDNNDILNVSGANAGVSAVNVYGNSFKNRNLISDTIFYGANSAGDNRVEYMKWNRSAQTLDFNAPIDNTGLPITGNIFDTTVSDERLKTEIEDVDTDFTSCITNVKVKTFKYKDDKYKTNDNYGFIAQELKEHLPKECKNIVKENKDKTSDDKFLSINYMKLSVVLWKCCQEQQSKIEHLEASIYEMMEDIKELKGKKTTKPKAKAKSKTKVENNYINKYLNKYIIWNFKSIFVKIL